MNETKEVSFDAPKQTEYRAPGLLLSALIITIIIIAIAFNYKSVFNEYDHQYSHLSSSLRANVLEIIKFAGESDRGNASTFTRLLDARNTFNSTINILKDGDLETGLPATAENNSAQLDNVMTRWTGYQDHVNTILSSEKVVRMTIEFSRAVNSIMPEVVDSSEQVISDLIQTQSDANLIFIASHQLLLAQRITTNMNLVNQQNDNTQKHVNALLEDAKTFRGVLESMLNGNKKSNINRIRNKSLRNKVSDLLFAFETVEELLLRVKEQSARLSKTRLAFSNLFDKSDKMLDGLNDLSDGYHADSPEHQQIQILIYILESVALIILIILILSLNKKTRKQLVSEEKSNKFNVDSIVKLQNEISPIAEGDLTITATVEAGITESIANTINISIKALRLLVTNINQMSIQVSETAEETQATAIHLAKASDQQAQQLTAVTNSINKMVGAFQDVARQAEESTQLANKSVEMAEQGGLTVRNTLTGMQTIADDIYDTSNRIKRLGESSQEIGDILELINDIADQTNILALNAAIKASVAGEAGHSFTAVADEVQQLAERVTQATKKIDSLVNSIQLDTSQAVISMEQSSTDVIHGTQLARKAGDALLRIETVSAHLADFITNVADATITLTDTSKQVSQAMNTIKKVTDHNLAGTKQTAALTGKLAELAEVQKSTVNGFKLPK